MQRSMKNTGNNTPLSPDEKISFLRAVSEQLVTISDIIAKHINYDSEGWRFSFSDTEAEETLNVLSEHIFVAMELTHNVVLSEQISVAKELTHKAQKRFPHRIVNRILELLLFLSSLLRTGQKFIGFAKAEGDAERIRGYIYDTCKELYLKKESLRRYADKLSRAANAIQNGSRSKKRKTQKEKADMLFSCLSHLAMSVDFIASGIENFELSQGNRKDYAAMVDWLTLKHEIYEARDALSYAKEKTWHPSFEEAEALLGLVYKYMAFDLDMFDIIEGENVGDEIVDSVTFDFSEANKCLYELQKLAVRLENLDQAALNNSSKAEPMAKGQSIKPVEELDENEKHDAITLIEFMQEYCKEQTLSLLKHRRKSLNDVHNRKTITLPKHIGKWKSGQKKYYKASDLKENWPRYLDALPNLPPLKQ